MKDIKIYISLNEAEKLVFNKVLILESVRQNVVQAQKNWAIAIYLRNEPIQINSDYLLIHSADISQFEIPEKEENLFLSHYKVPKGLYTTNPRKFKDDKNEKDIFDNAIQLILADEDIILYKGIRRGLMQCYHLAINESISKAFTSEALSLISDFSIWNTFYIDFIKAVVANEYYPSVEVNDGKFHTEAFKRFVWLGRITFNYTEKNKAYSKEEIEEGRLWLRSFATKEEVALIKSAIKAVPLIFENNYEFLLGYYFAASFYEEASVGEGYYFYLQKILEQYGLGANSKVLFWAIFFQSIYKYEIDYLYVISSLQDEQSFIEQSILSAFVANLTVEKVKLGEPVINENDRLKQYVQLVKGGNIKDLKIISTEELRSLYKNKISKSNLKSIGLENKGLEYSLAFIKLIRNSCEFGKNGFTLNLQNKVNEVTFYLSKDSEIESWLKDLKIKSKPINKLIDSSKKVLVSFVEMGRYEGSLLNLYEFLITQLHPIELFKEIVIVLMVNESTEIVQSVEFQRDKLKVEQYCKEVFGKNSHVFVKNLQNSSDGEIKRNLKHVLEKYAINQIELVDENIDDTILEWMISTNSSYILESEVEKRYSIINI